MSSRSISKTATCTLLCVASLTIMVGCVLVPGLPSIAARLGVADAASWLVTLPSLGVVLAGPFAAMLMQRLGLHRSLLAGLFLYGLLGVSGMFLHGHLAVFADRFLLGAPTALVMASGTALISALFSGQARLRMIARQGMTIELGGVLFLALGGLLATAGWRYPFLLYLASWVLLACAWRCVPAPGPAGDGGMDGPGPSRALLHVHALAALSMTVFFAAIIVLPLRLQQLGWSEDRAGYLLSFVSLVAVAAAWLMPQAVRRLHEHGTLGAAFACYALAHLLFAGAAALPALLAGAVALGMGFGLSVPLCTHMTVERSHLPSRNRNLAYLSMAIFGGQFLSSFMTCLPGSHATMFAATAALALLGAAVAAAPLLRRRAAGSATVSTTRTER
ncbi:MFS transporter [Janthinobacterium sp. FW305-129]|uniref:MFS transporter n=1 Tax=Janthinobacterium sp. FW305-129 TaxID=2775054 RepID=UPI0022A84C64|nr:MFS transporter [Janthinobacterium sp. FW305-129]MCC7596519.1 MFS transporter [Janthinobacterium sp. FW305-129]